MDSNGVENSRNPAIIYRLPRLTKPQWPGLLVDGAQLLILALWCGLLLAVTVVVPKFAWQILPESEALAFLAQFGGFMNLLGSGVGAFLLVTGLLQHTLELRRPRVIVIQMSLFLGMTLVLVACQIVFVQRLEPFLTAARVDPETALATFGRARGYQTGVQLLHATAFFLSLAAFAVGWRPRARRARPRETIEVFKLRRP